MNRRTIALGCALIAAAGMGAAALGSPSLRSLMRAAARTLLTIDEVPGADKSEDRPTVGGPTQFLDSIQSRTLMGRHVVTDLSVSTSTGPVTLNRYFTTSTDQQEEEADFPDTTVSPKLPAPPFDALAQWTHSFYSFVTQRRDYLPPDQAGDPRLKITYETVRYPSGDLNTFPNLNAASGWWPDRGAASDTWMARTDAGFVVRRPRDGRYYYEYLGVGDGGLTDTSINRWFLTRMEAEEYATAAGAARTHYTVSYRSATECGDAGVPRTFVDRVTMTDGQQLVFQYTTSNGSCGLGRVDYRTVDAGYTAVRYTYAQGQLTQVDTLDPVDAGTISSRSYAYSTNNFFEAYTDGQRDLRYDLFSPQFGVDAGVLRDIAGNTAGGLTWAHENGNPCGLGCNAYTSTDMTSGTGAGQAVSVKQTIYEVAAGAGYPSHVTQTKQQCFSGNCAGVSDLLRQWCIVTVPVQNTDGIDESSCARDARGYFTNYGWAPSPGGLANDELRWVAPGAVTQGTDAGLLYTAYTYEYGGSARSPSTNDRLLRSESSASVINPGQSVVTTYVHDLATTQLKAKITDGYTLLRGSPTAPATAPTHRYVGTFYFRSRVCDGSTTDPLGRVLEVHGPCEVTSLTATDCPAGAANMPLKQFFYAAQGTGPGAGLLTETRVSTKNGGAGTCGTAGGNNTYLSTLYQNYDEKGRPRTVVGPDGVPTTQQFRGDLLVQKTVGTGAPLLWQYVYDGARLTATKNPDGTYDVICYRSSDTSCTGGTLFDKPQWKAKAMDTAGTNWITKTKYGYFRGRLIAEHEFSCPTATCTALGGELRRTLRHEADPYGRATYEQVGDEQLAQTPSSGAYYAASLYDAEGNQTAIGFPFVPHAQLCGGLVDGVNGHASSGSNCARLDYDAVNRLTALYPLTGASVCVAYDTLGRVSSIALTQGNCTQPSLEQVTYTYDDFGNLVRVKAPWTKGSNGLPDVNAYEYDGRGVMSYKQTPAMRTAVAAEWLEHVYDANGRQLQVWHKNTDPSGPVTEMLYGFDYDAPNASFPCAFSTDAFAKGRVARRQDSYGSTWYKYDQFGHVLAEVRSRGQSAQSCGTPALPNFGSALCSTGTAVDPSDSKLPTFYHYDGFGRLDAMRYPHGRVVRFAYDAQGRMNQVSADLNISGTCASSPLISGIRWEPWGAPRGYQVNSPTTASTSATVEYFLGTHSLNACNASPPSSSGTVGRIGALYVSRGTGNTGDIYKAGYLWTADQLVSESQCLLSTSSTEKPRIVYYANPAGDPSFRGGYDSALQLKYANRPTTAGLRLSDVGGTVGRRDYAYDALGNRTAAATDCWKFSATYDATRKDQLTAYTSISAAPNPTGATSPACDASPFSTANYTYDNDGRVATTTSPVDSSGSPAVQLSFNAGIDDHAAIGAVYRSIDINPAHYEYWYDADGRRRLKVYPQNGRDEFFYGLDNQLLEDRGLKQTGVPNSGDEHPLDEYVWLGGRPVLVFRSMLDSSWRRGNDTPTATCTRNYETSACGVYFVVSDYLPKPVLMLDSNLHVVNAAEYDPFGHVNRVASLGHTPHPYNQVNKSILGYFSQPPTATTSVQLRARFSMVDTSGSAAYAYLGNDQNAQLNNIGGTLSSTVWGVHQGAALSEWVPVPANGRARVVFHADASSSTYKGIALAGYEYRRFETSGGAKTTWIPLRFPGQYHDAETDLFQNWNRFYDPNTGRYLESDPIWLYSERMIPRTRAAKSMPVYSYAGGNPISRFDPDGLAPDELVRAWESMMMAGLPPIAQAATSATLNYGVYFSAGVAAEGVGVAASGGMGAGVLLDQKDSLKPDLALFTSFGAEQGMGPNETMAGYCSINNSTNYTGGFEDIPSYNMSAGAYAGMGIGLGITNAMKSSDLAGLNPAWNANIGWPSALQFSVQFSTGTNAAGDHIWNLAVQWRGASAGFSMSTYPQATQSSGLR